MTETFNPGIKPLGNRILLKPIEVENKTSGGIILPDTALEKHKARQQEAIVVDMGVMAFQLEVGGILQYTADKPKIGDKVRVIKYVGDTFVGDDGLEYKLINDQDILAITTRREN